MPGLLDAVGASAIYNMLKDVAGLISRWARGTAVEHLQKQAKWKPLVEEEILRRRRDRLRSDVIIRDVRRIKEYPDQVESRRISSWFRVGLAGIYHRGIEVALGIHSLVREESEDSWRLADMDEKNIDKLTAYLIGYIPWENIEHIDFSGDEFYSYPHIFCRFRNGGEPYERMAFCERKELMPGHEFYTHIETREKVKLTSEKFGTASWAWRSS